MPKKIIHIARQALQQNLKDGGNRPAIIVRRGRKSTRHHQVEILDERNTVVARVVHKQTEPLPCGARVWIEVPGLVAVPLEDEFPSDAEEIDVFYRKGEFQ